MRIAKRIEPTIDPTSVVRETAGGGGGGEQVPSNGSDSKSAETIELAPFASVMKTSRPCQRGRCELI